MAESVFETRRLNRRSVLEALRDETGSSGGDLAAPRVAAYCADPLNAAPREYSYVGSLALSRFYIDPTKPDGAQRLGLWTNVRTRLGKAPGAVPQDISGSSVVGDIQAMAELRP